MKRYILIVDDDDRWRARMRDEVGNLGFEVLEADGYHAAHVLIDRYEEELAFVACDNSMPIGDRAFPEMGIELLAGMRITSHAQAAIPFILFTSEITPPQRERVTGMQGVVVLKRHDYDGDLTVASQKILGL